MDFAGFLKRNYNPKEEAGILALLHETGIYRDIEALVNKFYVLMNQGVSDDLQSHCEQAIHRYIVIALRFLKKKTNENCNEPFIGEMMNLGLAILDDMQARSDNNNGEMQKIIQQSFFEVSKRICDSDMRLIWSESLKHHFSQPIARNIKPGTAAQDKKRASKNYMHWKVYVKDRARGISQQGFIKDFYEFFERLKPVGILDFFWKPPYINYHATIDPDDQDTYIMLFFELEKCDRIYMDIDNGLFSFLEYRTKPPRGKEFKKKSTFREIKYRILKNKKKAAEIGRTIAWMKEKYCTPED